FERRSAHRDDHVAFHHAIGGGAIQCEACPAHVRASFRFLDRVQATLARSGAGRTARGGSICHIGGTSPFLPTAIRVAVTLPSPACVAKPMTCALGTSMAVEPGSNVTIGVPGGTTTVFSPPLYETVRV